MKTSAPLPRQGGILRPALVVFAALSLVTGLAYPFLTTGIAAAVFPHQAAGSLIKQGDRVVGSELIGQSFSSPGYFWGRPSATAPMPYNGASSGGSNLGPRNPALAEAIQARIAALKEADPANPVPVPVDLVTASGSGLDPHISPAAAAYQAERVARARNLPRAQVDALIQAHTEKPWLGVLGDPAVNVLELNLALDQLSPAR
ncbi:Potassium-transporting ATPase KdpC subunit [Achromobacter anxifer]|jgi:K+-transporting ATPase ATPase C chain|uniref:Potassium-transporting ATPase KdpC subunit n=1 Tax=Achromobacter anxifer TaxID=1287737 RepID=A0A6S7BW15_9BURK|nr:potassium-transporting ATPase subunit KdpC [Achromobacter anxifer]CAB3819757.1 Potassium-transporting ATPase KdpC subunit [Achromobacter anxifer]CAB5513128.1 Potassium-transporting ATPase KdpC subunit [Achromobacter anxifer]